jgi:hypothetical protein
VPCAALEELFFTTDSLIDELKKCDDAPVCELDAVGVAFRKAAIPWKDNHPKPLMRRKTYLKKHFEAEENIKNKLTALHAAYVKKFAAKGKKTKTLSAADVNKEDNKENENRLRIYQEIDRLRKNGYSVLKAIESMSNGSYGSRMRGVSAATWKRYYFERSRRNRLADAAKRKTTPTSNEECLTRAIKKTLDVIDGEVSRIEIMKAVGIKDRATFTNYYLTPALKLDLIEMTQPNSPRSPTQRYRLTEKGRAVRCA